MVGQPDREPFLHLGLEEVNIVPVDLVFHPVPIDIRPGDIVHDAYGMDKEGLEINGGILQSISRNSGVAWRDERKDCVGRLKHGCQPSSDALAHLLSCFWWSSSSHRQKTEEHVGDSRSQLALAFDQMLRRLQFVAGRVWLSIGHRVKYTLDAVGDRVQVQGPMKAWARSRSAQLR